MCAERVSRKQALDHGALGNMCELLAPHPSPHSFLCLPPSSSLPPASQQKQLWARTTLPWLGCLIGLQVLLHNPATGHHDSDRRGFSRRKVKVRRRSPCRRESLSCQNNNIKNILSTNLQISTNPCKGSHSNIQKRSFIRSTFL